MTGCDLCGVGPDDECSMDCPSRCDALTPPIKLHVTDAQVAAWLDARCATPDMRAAAEALTDELRTGVRPNVEFLTLADWIDYGVDQGWVSGACATHDGIPYTPTEEDAWEEGLAPCAPILRVWIDGEREAPS